jgi:hypothetical protein
VTESFQLLELTVDGIADAALQQAGDILGWPRTMLETI